MHSFWTTARRHHFERCALALLVSACVGAPPDEPARAGDGWELLDDGSLVLEGDMIYARPETVAALLTELRDEDVAGRSEALTVYRFPSRDELSLVPAADRRNLTYCISPELECALPGVREAIRVATEEWAVVADLVFRHVPEEDANCGSNSTNVYFAFVAKPGRLALGRAHMPGEARPSLVELFPESWGFLAATSNPVDQLRTTLTHEIGHGLGFAHAFGAPGFEESEWADEPLCSQQRARRAGFAAHPLSDFDVDSIMNYLSCGRDAVAYLSLGDASGASEVYCPPGHGPPPCTAPALVTLPPRPSFREGGVLAAHCPGAAPSDPTTPTAPTDSPPPNDPVQTCAFDAPGACVEGDVFARVACDGSPGYIECEGTPASVDGVLAARCTCTSGEWICPCADGTQRSDCAPDPAQCSTIANAREPAPPADPQGCAVHAGNARGSLAWGVAALAVLGLARRRRRWLTRAIHPRLGE